MKVEYVPTPEDRAAAEALRLFLRAWEVHEGEEDWQSLAETFADGIESMGLPFIRAEVALAEQEADDAD